MDHLDAYLDLGYTGIFLVSTDPTQETVVCRDRRGRYFRLVSHLDTSGPKPKLVIERNEMISEVRYLKIAAEHGGVLDTDEYRKARHQRHMARLALQHELSNLIPPCPRCGLKMALDATAAVWSCPDRPRCPGAKRADATTQRRVAEITKLLAG